MRWIKYQIVQTTNGEEPILVNKKVGYSNENLVIAQSEAYDGYEIIEDEMVFEKEPLDMHNARIKNVGYAEEDGDALALAFAKILFAPSGYGLGSYGQTAPDNDANQITGSGFFRAYVNTPDPDVWWNIINIECYNDWKASFQIANGYKLDGMSSICVRQKHNNVYGEWEWLNAPMTLGVEYRTTERYNGNVVYAKHIYFGQLPAKGSWKGVDIGVPYNKIVRIIGKAVDIKNYATENFPLTYDGAVGASFYVDKNGKIFIGSYHEKMMQFEASFIIYYSK